MKKRILSMLLVLIMVVGVIPATTLTAFAAITDVPFTSDSKAVPGNSMTVDLEALAEQDEAFMDAYFNNSDIIVTWYLNGTKVTTNISGSFGEAIYLTDADGGKSLYVTIEADGNTYTSKTFVVETLPDVYVGGVKMTSGTYLAVGATKTQTTKPSGGYAYYKNGTLTLNNYNYYGEGYGFGTVYTNVTDLTIELLGDNTLVQTKSGRDAICADGANLTIGGTGNLTCRGEDHGIWVGGELTINRGTITAIGNTKAIRYTGSYGFSVADGLTIQASTTVDGELGEYVSANHDSYKKIVVRPAPDIYVGGVGMYDGDYLAVGATATQTTKPSGGYAYYENGKLTLNNYSYKGYGYDGRGSRPIIYDPNDIQIELVGNNTLTHKSNWNTACITVTANVSLTGEGTLNLQNATWGIDGSLNISIESGSLNIDNCDLGIYSFAGKVIINGGNFEVNAIDCAVNGSKGIEINGGNGTFRNMQEDVYSVLHSLNGTVTIDPSLIVMASTTADGELGEYVAENHASYEKIVIKTPGVYVGGVGMCDGDYLAVGATKPQITKPYGGYAYYKNGTLTLNNYSYEGEGYRFGVVYIPGTDLTIELLGDNTLVQTKSGRDAICADMANLTIDGTGKLTCRGEDHGIWVGNGLTISGGTITAIGNIQAIRYYSSDGFSVAEGLKMQASTTEDGALGEYVAANHDSYKKIVIKPDASNITVNCLGDIDYTVSGKTVTVNHEVICKVGYLSGEKYEYITAAKNADGTYSYTAPDSVTEVILFVNGDVTGDGAVDSTDYLRIKGHFLGTYTITGIALESGDVTSDGVIDSTDYLRIKGHFLGTYNLHA